MAHYVTRLRCVCCFKNVHCKRASRPVGTDVTLKHSTAIDWGKIVCFIPGMSLWTLVLSSVGKLSGVACVWWQASAEPLLTVKKKQWRVIIQGGLFSPQACRFEHFNKWTCPSKNETVCEITTHFDQWSCKGYWLVGRVLIITNATIKLSYILDFYSLCKNTHKNNVHFIYNRSHIYLKINGFPFNKFNRWTQWTAPAGEF